MQLFARTVAVMVLALPGWPANEARGDEAGQIFQNCLAEVRQTVERTTAAHARIVRECTPVIRQLLADGQVQQARELAERCIRQINSIARQGTESVQQTCSRCIRRLEELGATGLANQLREHCVQAVRTIEQSRARAVEAIRRLF